MIETCLAFASGVVIGKVVIEVHKAMLHHLRAERGETIEQQQTNHRSRASIHRQKFNGSSINRPGGTGTKGGHLKLIK